MTPNPNPNPNPNPTLIRLPLTHSRFSVTEHFVEDGTGGQPVIVMVIVMVMIMVMDTGMLMDIGMLMDVVAVMVISRF